MTLAARKIRLIIMLRQAGITDPRVLSAIELVPREIFVPEIFRDQAYENVALPIGHGQTISQPVVVGLMTQALQIGERMKVLEIGTGSGYQTAILSKLCRRVYTVERHRPLLRDAEARLEQLGLRNVTTRYGDGSEGWRPVAPFDRILAAAAAAEVPANLADQLAEGGVMITPVGTRRDDQRLVRVTRDASGFKTEEMVRVHFVPLVPSVGEADNGSEHRPESGPESAVPGTAPPSRSEGGAQ
ncbi:protein-L-isoaspartate(D-aspartate) O-methyltransferase [Constrictibacter sp. MBR-5]